MKLDGILTGLEPRSDNSAAPPRDPRHAAEGSGRCPMRSLRWLIVLSLVAAAWPFAGRAQTTAVALFQEALTLERAEGRLDEAIFRYERVVAEFPADRPVVA